MHEFSIDLDHLDKYVTGDDALRDEILSIFQDQANKLLSELKANLDDDSWHMTTHSLKGAARGIGAWKLGDICESAEDLVGTVSAKSEKRDGTIIAIKTYVADVIKDVEVLRDKNSTA